jgi:hypothetical protein
VLYIHVTWRRTGYYLLYSAEYPYSRERGTNYYLLMYSAEYPFLRERETDYYLLYTVKYSHNGEGDRWLLTAIC